LSASDWTAILESSDELASLYAHPPSLTNCGLTYLHIDERGGSLTMGFETAELPSHPPAEWAARPYNTIEFYLHCTDVTELHIRGWDSTARRGVTLALRTGGGVRVAIDEPGTRLSCTAARVAVTRVRSYLADR